MFVIQIAPSLSHSTGGLFVSISSLARASLEQGVRIAVFAPRDGAEEAELASWRPMETRWFRTIGPKAFSYSPGLLAALRAAEADIVHAHGIWAFPSVAAFWWGKHCRRPYIVSVHGMLEPWALQQSRFKKRIARFVYQDRVLLDAACIRATSDMELESIRAAGLRTPVALVPNGIDLPPKPSKNLRESSRSFRTALFVSRLHPKKGLLNLVEAWRRIRPPDWKLVIVGPDEGGYGAHVQTAITAAGLDDSVKLVGPSWGQERFQHYWSADLFVLPSFSENFGMVIAEALACEVPVITTKGLPWRELEERGCGWWIDVGVESLVEALRDAFQLSDQSRCEMGARGRQLVAENYTWQSAGLKMNEVYDWVYTGGPQPPTVLFD